MTQKRKYTMSEAARAQRRAAGKVRASQFTSESQRQAGLALKSKVSMHYFSIIGSLGYKQMYFNLYSRLAETFEPDEQDRQNAASAAHLEEYKHARRALYREQAEKYRPVATGTRVMLQLLTPDVSLAGKVIKIKVRRRKASKRRAVA